ncbi:MAG: NIPSNAP family protein [Gemmatimonadetes bacterium]|nr:NIPSNAP family protein [Gemmatimonadota bacterium]
MATSKRFLFAGVAAVFGAGFLMGSTTQGIQDAQAQSADRVFELRTYTAPEGKLPNLQARFRDHTMRIFENHGITNIGYWTPQDEPNASNTLVYIIAHDSREAAAASWDAFRADPEWQTVSRESQVDGRIVSGVVSVFLDPLDFSPIQ